MKAIKNAVRKWLGLKDRVFVIGEINKYCVDDIAFIPLNGIGLESGEIIECGGNKFVVVEAGVKVKEL